MKWRADAACAALLPLLLAGCDSAESVGVADGPKIARTASFVPTGAVPRYEATGYASWYGDELRGRRTASGELFDPDAMTAAHRDLPLLSYVEVTAMDTGRSVVARVNDRGPFSSDRLIDLSHGAARQLGISGDGHARVRIRRVDAGAALIAAPATPPAEQRMAKALPLPDGAPRYVQIASFSSSVRAHTMADRIGARVDRAGAVYRVRFGPFASDGTAKQALREASAKGYPEAQILPDSAP